MKRALFYAVFLALTPAVAQEFSVSLSWDQARTRSNTYATNNPDNSLVVHFPSKDKSAIGLHFGWIVSQVGVFNLELAGTYQFPKTTELPFDYQRSTLVGTVLGSGVASYKCESFAPGLRLSTRRILDFGVGVEYRIESLRFTGADPDRPSSSFSTHLRRPWTHLSIGYTWPGARIHPFLAASWAMAWTQPSNSSTLDPNFLKSVAPRYETSLQAGLRF